MAKIVLFDELPIRVDAQGAWLHGDKPLHPRVATLFAKNVVPHADGTYWVELGPSKHVIEPVDTAFHARTVLLEHDAKQGLRGATLVLSDGLSEPLDFATLMQSADDVFYCRIRRHGWSVPCRLKPADYHALALHAELHGETAVVVTTTGAFPIAPYEPSVRPA